MTNKIFRFGKKAKHSPENRRSRHKKPLWKKIILITMIIILAGLLTGGGLFAYYASQAPPLDAEKLSSPSASEILDKHGEVIATIGNKNRDVVTYENIPSLVENAVLATEDSRFYDHIGIDPIRLGGAVLANITEGIGSEGGSTLTQQLVKRSFLTSEKTLKRKAQEAWLALKMENNYSKEEIFQMYVNKIYYSDTIYGIQTASRYYFDKELQELSLPQAALLAGIPQSPNNYNPYDYPERAEERRNIVLSLMEGHGKITEQEMKEAQQAPITEGLVSRSNEERMTLANRKGDEAFIDVVLDEIEQYGDHDPFEDGLTIHTTLDPEAQMFIEKMLNTEEIIQYPADKNGEPFQAGITLLDTQTGAVQAVGGGRNYGKDVQRGYNFATDTNRQPGSAIKPLLVYAPAIEKMQWSTAHVLVDEPIEYENGIQPRNWDDQFKGPVSIREALRESRNIPAIKAFNQTGHDYAASFIENLGLHADRPMVESSAIGGSDFNTNSFDLAGAFAALGNSGTYTAPYTVTEIELRDGTTIDTVPESSEVMKPSTAYMVTDMLKDVIQHPEGTANNITLPDLPVAGKSGTTNYSKEMREEFDLDINHAPDSWFAGYTTRYTAAIWTGYATKENFLTSEERQTAQEIFQVLLNHVSAGTETPDFEQPSNIVKVEIEAGTNPPKLSSPYTPEEHRQVELFIKGTEPAIESDQYVPQLQAPVNLDAIYNQESQSIILSWDHRKAENDDRQVSFEVTMAESGEEAKVIATTAQEETTIENIKPNKTYTFTVTANTEDEQSNPAIIRVETPLEPASEPESNETDNEDSENNSGNRENEETEEQNENNNAEEPETNDNGSSEQPNEEPPAENESGSQNDGADNEQEQEPETDGSGSSEQPNEEPPAENESGSQNDGADNEQEQEPETDGSGSSEQPNEEPPAENESGSQNDGADNEQEQEPETDGSGSSEQPNEEPPAEDPSAGNQNAENPDEQDQETNQNSNSQQPAEEEPTESESDNQNSNSGAANEQEQEPETNTNGDSEQSAEEDSASNQNNGNAGEQNEQANDNSESAAEEEGMENGANAEDQEQAESENSGTVEAGEEETGEQESSSTDEQEPNANNSIEEDNETDDENDPEN